MNNPNERWYKFNALEQMGNIGSEVYRAFSWRGKKNTQESEKAMERALELFDLTLSDPRWLKTNRRLKEISMAKEIFCDLFFGKNEYNDTVESLMQYFDEFALAARKNK